MDRRLAGLAAARPVSELPEGIVAELDTEQRRLVRRCLLVLGGLGALSMVGATSILYLANHFPLLLIALSPIGRHLILVAPTVSAPAFVTIATLRRLAFYLPCFLLGRTLGSRALLWLESRSSLVAQTVRWLDRLFQRARYPAVFLLLGPIMSTIAGNAQMSLSAWLPLVAAGLVLRMVVIVWFGEWLREPIELVLGWFDEYWIPGTLVIVTGTLLYQRSKRRMVSAAAAPEE